MDKDTSQMIKLLQAQIKQQLNQISILTEQNHQLIAQIKELTHQNEAQTQLMANMQAQLNELLRVRFGQKSERTKSKKPKGPDDNGPPFVVKQDKTESSKKRGRKKPPEHLERVRIEYELSEAERVCPDCGKVCQRIGEDISEQLEYIPARLYVKAHVRHKYACQSGCGIKTALMPAQPIDKGLAGPALLADVIISKYQDHLPLYRQALRFKRYGVEIAESTLCDWVKACANLLSPIVSRMKELLLLSDKLHSDDTPIPVLAKDKAKKGRLWTYVADHTQAYPITVYDYTPTRSQSGPVAFLGNFKGFLQADAYSGYDVLYKNGKIIEVGCLAHVRRKFFEVSIATKNETRANEALSLIGEIYEIEAKIKGMSPESKYFYRKKHSKIKYRQFYRWLKKTKRIIIRNTPLCKAIVYALNHWRALQNVLSDGSLQVDNNTAERAMKPVVLGRKNYLFAGNDEGGKSAAIIYSIIETCKQNAVNTFDYLKDIFTRLPRQLNNKLDELLPFHWLPAKI